MIALANIPKAHKCMTRYEFLRSKQESGELQQWYQYGLAPQTKDWMKYYAFKQAHPEKSCLEIANIFHRGHSTIQRALSFMNQPHM